MDFMMDQDSANDHYSFHLDYVETESTYSNQPSTSSLSNLHKQRIDTLFRSKRRLNKKRQQQKISKEKQNASAIKISDSSHVINKSKHRVLIHNTVNDSPKIRRQPSDSSNNTVSIRQTPSTIINITNTDQPSTIVNENRFESQHRVAVKHLTRQNTSPQEELTQAFGGRTLRQKSFRENRSAVQAQIEKLFSDAGKSNNNIVRRVTNTATSPQVPTPPPPPPPSANTPDPPPPPPPSLKTHPAFRNSPTPSSPSTLKRNTPSPMSSGMQSNCSTVSRTSTMKSSNSSGSQNSNMVYRVDYLGAIQLPGKATSLDVLQDPLKQLYYKHKHNVTLGKRVPLSTLSITEAGLRIMRNTSIREELDFTNSFASIAVWAAIKMVIKKKINNSGQVSYTYAFLPLICDPDVQEKFNTYHPLNVSDPTIMDTSHPPMFACVMRKIEDSTTLECHGFICRSSEDAIVIAANLYQALLGTMNSDTPTSGSFNVDSRKGDLDGVMSDSEVIPRPPPRRRKTPPSSTHGTLRRSSSEDMLRTANNLDVASNKLRKSIRKRNTIKEERKELAENNHQNRLPRSKSVANVQKSLDGQNSTVDLRKKVTLNNVDDILKTIINPNGMSFSEMDPQHREMLMKMALIMSKDEIYKRSKNIMRSQRSRSSGFMSGFESDSDVSTISSVLKATKKSISRFGSRASNSLRPSYLKERTPLRKFNLHGDFTTYQPKSNDLATRRLPGFNQIVSDASLSQQNLKTPLPQKKLNVNKSIDECSIYGDCCDNDSECSCKCYCTLPLQNESKTSSSSCSNKDSEPNQIVRRKMACACESDSCAESEKCYCSLKSIKKSGLKMYEINLDSDTDTTVATTSTIRRKVTLPPKRRGSQSYFSDNDSRTSSWNRRNDRIKTSFTMERSRSKSPSVVISPKPEAIRRQKSMSPGIHDLSERNSILRSSRALQNNTNTIRLNRNRTLSNDSVLRQSRRYRRHSGSLGSQGSTDSSRSSPGVDSQHSDGSSEGDNSAGTPSSSISQQMLMLSAVEPSGKVVYRSQSQRKRMDAQNPSSVLSIKKTAEIAALFSELKLEQKTDLINRLQRQVNIDSTDSDEQHYEIMQNSHQSFMFSDRIENSLGYLP